MFHAFGNNSELLPLRSFYLFMYIIPVLHINRVLFIILLSIIIAPSLFSPIYLLVIHWVLIWQTCLILLFAIFQLVRARWGNLCIEFINNCLIKLCILFPRIMIQSWLWLCFNFKLVTCLDSMSLWGEIMIRIGNVKIRITFTNFKFTSFHPFLLSLVCNVVLISHILSITFHHAWKSIPIIFRQTIIFIWHIALWSIHLCDCCDLWKGRCWADKARLRKGSRDGLLWRLKLILKINFRLRWRWIDEKSFIW